MSVFFYHIFLFLFKAGAVISSLFNSKTKKWLQGRKNIFETLKAGIPADERIVWMHCASLGEFEQGRPLLEQIRSQYPKFKLLLTFFSPSGYEVQKDYPGADQVLYLPMDSPSHAKRFLEIVHPSLVIFVKYDFWYFYLKELKQKNIPLLLVSALFSKDMVFFKWYGRLQRKMLPCFTHFFVQNPESKKLLDEMLARLNRSSGGFSNSTVAGDTRFDRVIEIAEQWEPIAVVELFIDNSKVIVAGSTWHEDDIVLQKAFESINDPSLKLIIAPHELDRKNLNELKRLFPGSIKFSEILNSNSLSITTNVLIIDNIGLLSRLYKYGYITYIGGGLRPMGVHNVLEAAVYYKPVLFGEYFRKYAEAVQLVLSGGGLPFNDEKRNGKMAGELMEALLANKEEYEYRAHAAGDFVLSHKGATQKIMQFIQEKRLLTN